MGASPGTLHPDPAAQPTVLAAIGFGPEEVATHATIDLAALPALRAKWPVVWIDVTGFADLDLLRAIGAQFGLHRLALEDVLNRNQRAKVEDYGAHQFLVLRMVDPTNRDDTEQLGLFVGPGFVLTFQERAGDCFGLVRKRLADPTGQMRKRGSDYLAYALLDAVVDAYFPVVEDADARLEVIEEGVLAGRADAQIVPELHAVRRCLLTLRRAIWPLREATSALVRGEAKHFSPEVWPYLRDVNDHVVQLLDLLENYREMSSSLMDLHLSMVNHRLNEVMKLLTVISTIFIPLSFLVGVYGMNFEWMPELKWKLGYPMVWAVIFTVAVTMLLVFRKKKWF